VQALGAHSHLSPQTKLSAIGKARAGVDINRRRVNFIDKFICMFLVACKDAIRVVRAMLMDMI
jgi:hypothetical protein